MSQIPSGRYSIGLAVVSFVWAMMVPISHADEIELKVVTYNVLVELSAPAGIPPGASDATRSWSYFAKRRPTSSPSKSRPHANSTILWRS